MPPGPDPGLHDTLAEGAARLGCTLAPEQLAQLRAYRGLLQRASRIHNLTSIHDQAAIDTLHLLDALALVPAIDRYLAATAATATATATESDRTVQPDSATPTILDVGSGAGLPGVVIAIARPHWRVVCLDAVAKKMRFVQQAAIELGLTNLAAVHARAEQAPPVGADLVVSRAFASLADFVGATRRHLRPDGVWVAMKGRAPADEIAALPSDVAVFHVEPLRVPGLDAERCLVWMRQAA
ncbi:MAG: 16S rRNA (guanine(527)-N(7))-methyltransferase RsmG [Burkholderiales bacterium]|nr:16S rRNA (guanine(527)-N(7))-methyltransferase RsmG [Burkholderiales bacterium]